MEGWQAKPLTDMKVIPILLALCLPVLATEEDKVALRNLSATYEKAIASRDLAALKPHLAADFTAVMITADEVKGFDGILSYWKKVEDFLGKDGTYRVTIEPDDTIFEGNIAIAKGRANENAVRSGKTLNFVSQWTAIARKEASGNCCVSRRASILWVIQSSRRSKATNNGSSAWPHSSAA
jgi:ketosteroid isomerase-like protein